MKILNDFSEALNIIIEYSINTENNIIVAIDGRCASGKTTFSRFLAEKLPCNVIHLDDFFLQVHQRTAERLSTPGGNVDIERFKYEVIKGILSGKDYSFRPFNCKTMSLAEPVFMKTAKVTVIEGSYSTHPEIAQHSDIKFFITTSPEKQRERVLFRNTKNADMFFSKWIPLEESYFSWAGTENKCDFKIIT